MKQANSTAAFVHIPCPMFGSQNENYILVAL